MRKRKKTISGSVDIGFIHKKDVFDAEYKRILEVVDYMRKKYDITSIDININQCNMSYYIEYKGESTAAQIEKELARRVK